MYGNTCTWYEDTGAQNEDGVATEGIVVVAALVPPLGLAAAMLGEKSRLLVDGRVQFTDLSIDKPGNGYSITFKVTRGVVDPAKVLTFTVEPFNVSYGYPYRLVFDFKPGSDTEVSDPKGATPGYPLSQQPRIMVQDRIGNVVGDERGVLEITATLLQDGEPAVRPLQGTTVLNSCLYKDSTTNLCGCIQAAVTGCGVVQWPVTQNGLRIDSVGEDYTIIFQATFRENYMEFDDNLGSLVQKFREIVLLPVTSMVFEVNYGAVHSIKVTKQPWGFVLNEVFLGQPQVAVYDKAQNFVPTNDVEVVSDFVVVDGFDGSSLCCFNPTFKIRTSLGLANFEGMKLLAIPNQGNVLRLRFSSLSIVDSYVETESFIMANTPVRIHVAEQPATHLPGIGFTRHPKISLLDLNYTVAGWYKDAPMVVTATLCLQIPCVFGKFVSALRTASPCFKCTTDSSTFCDLQTQTPVLLKPRTIPTEAQMIRGTMTSVAFNGVSIFTDLVIDKIGTYKFRFATPGYATIESTTFTLFHGVASRLNLQAQPKGAYSGFPLSQQPVVVIWDAGNNVVTSDLSTTITASLVNSRNIANAKLFTPNDNIMGPFVCVTHGALYWQRLQVDVAGTYEILFTSSLGSTNCMPVTSASFEILCSPPVNLVVVKAPDDCIRGSLCNVQPIVEVQDAQGNKATVTRGFNTSITAISCTWSKRFPERTVVDGTLTMYEIGVLKDALWHAGCDGRYQMILTGRGLVMAKSDIFQVSDPATNTSVVVSLSPGEAGENFRQQPLLQLTDEHARRVRGTGSSITASLLKCDNGGPCKPFTSAPIIGTRSVDTLLGLSDFTNLRLDMAGTCYRFLFNAPGMVPGTSSLFDVKVGTVVSLLQITQHPLPKGAIVGRAFPVQPVIAVLDSGKNVLLFQNSLQITGTLLIDAQISLTELKGDRTTVVTNGVGTFTDMFTNVRGACFKLTFEVYGKFALTNEFYVGPGAPARLFLQVEPSKPHVGWPFDVQPVISFYDGFQNVVNHMDCEENCHLLNTQVSATLLPEIIENPDEVLQGNKTIEFKIDPTFGSRASFTNLRIDRAGTYNIKFTSVSGLLESVLSQTLTVIAAEDRANHLDVLVQPYGVRSTAPIVIQPVVAIHDLGNNLIRSADTNVTARLLGGYQCGSAQYPDKFKCGPWVTDHTECGEPRCSRSSNLELVGTRTVETKNGIATFTDLWIRYQPTRFVQLEFSSGPRCTPADGPCDSIKSYVFDVGGAVAYFDLIQKPSNMVVAGQPFPIQPRLSIFDASGRRHTWAPPSSFQAMNVSSYQNVSTWCNSSQTREELKGTGYDCNINRTNTSALNISQYGAWDQLEGNMTNVNYLDSFVNFTDLRFNRVARSRSGYHLKFTFRAITDEFFTVDWCCVKVDPAEPNTLVIQNHPRGPRVGQPFESQARMIVVDRFGNLATYEFGKVTAKLYQNNGPVPKGSVERIFGSNIVSAERGVVQFENLGYNQSGSNFTVGFIFPSVPIAFSENFDIFPGNMIHYLHIARSPNGFSENGKFSVQPIVETHDLGGNKIALNASYTPFIQVSLINGTSGARLLGQTSVNASDGAAIFRNLAISKAGTGIKLRFLLANSTVYDYFPATIYRTIPARNENETTTYVPNGTISNVSVYFVDVLSHVFDVANNESRLAFSQAMTLASSGGVQFETQPIVSLQDHNAFTVSNHEDMTVSAQLLMYGSSEKRCPVERPWRCGIESGKTGTACTLSEAACPQLQGTTTQVLRFGVAAFHDLFINGCNDWRENGCYSAKYKIQFTTRSSREIIVLETEQVNISIGSPMGAVLKQQPEPSTAGAGFALSTQPVVWIVDAGGNRVNSWSENASTTLVRGLVTACCDKCVCPKWSGQTEVSPSHGAFVYEFAIDTAGIDYKFSFTTGPFTVESSSFTMTVGEATHLRIIRQPLPGLKLYGGSPFLVQPVIEVLDRGLNVVKNYAATVQAQLLPNEFGAKLTGIVTVTVNHGIASYVTMTINREGSCYVVRFTSGSLKPINAVPMTVDIGLPSRMKFVKAPSGFRPGYAWDTQPVVAVVDEGDNIVPNARDTIEITLLDENQVVQPLCSFNLMGAPICETAVKAVNGIATFSGLRADIVGKDYTLMFGKVGGGYRTVTSQPFNVDVGPEFQLFMGRQLSLSTISRGQPGYLFPVQPVISIRDAGGNLVPTTSRRVAGELYRLNQRASDTKPELWQVQMQMYDPSITLATVIERVTARPSFEGRAIYSNLRVDVAAPNYMIRFRSENMLSVDSSIFQVDLGAADSTAIHRAPAGLKSGMPFIVQPIVHIVDRGMNTLHTLNPTYRMISAVDTGEGLMYPFPAIQGIIEIIDGVSAFSKLTITGRGEHTIKFSAFSFKTDTTAVFNVSGESHSVSIKEEPVGSVAAAVMQVQPQTYIRDDITIIVDTDSKSRVTASIVPESNLNKAVLSGTLIVDCCWGQCKFTDLVISKSGQMYQLAFSSAGLTTDISLPFKVGGPSNLTVSIQPAAAVSEFAIGDQPVIHVSDMQNVKQAYCNRDNCDIGGPAEVTATIKPGTGGLELCSLVGNKVATVVNGVATFTSLEIKGAGRSFQERKYILMFSTVDLYPIESDEFTLGYTQRGPTNYVQAAVQVTRFSVETFTTKEQTIFVDTIAKYLGISNTEVELIQVRDIIIRFRDEVRRTLASLDTSALPSVPHTRVRESLLPGQAQSQRHQHQAHMHEDEAALAQSRPVLSLPRNPHVDAGGERRREETGIDIRLRVYSENTKDLFRLKEDLTALLKREGALAEALSDGGLSNLKAIMTEAPEVYTPSGGLLAPLVESNPAAAIAGSLVGAFVVFMCTIGCYTMWFRARKRALIRAENEVDSMKLLYALGIEDPKDDIDAAMPWTAEKMLEGSNEEVAGIVVSLSNER